MVGMTADLRRGHAGLLQEVVQVTFGGDLEEARKHVRLFMVPGMGHCRGGPGPNQWDKLAPLVEWVEQGKVPDFWWPPTAQTVG